MDNLKIITDPGVNEIFQKYPEFVRFKMDFLRSLILETAKETAEITELEETLKWGEPSFLTKIGSTIRMDWKPGTPEQYALYFKCTSKLVDTFKKVYGPIFRYEGNRAIVFKLNDKLPVPELKQCITAALTYHKVKKKLNLGLYEN
ncbi:MAG: DUF1801 domain-containing protein [Flavobacteriales bacterium]|nr:DUF1801 domain-containing protein [Flavobacteriales bacterium]